MTRRHHGINFAKAAGNITRACSFFVLLLSCQLQTAAQAPAACGFHKDTDTVKSGRIWILAGSTAAIYTSSLLALDKYWYKDFGKRSFHMHNDNGEWLQMDKAGHMFSAYMLSDYSREIWRWSGLPRNKQIWIGGLSGFAYLSVIELLDAHSVNWGFSWGDMAANTAGVAMMMSQEFAWNEQRIRLKFSSHSMRYSDPVLQLRSSEQFGNNNLERLFKDYNTQTYWLSMNLHSIMKDSRMPRWLNVAVGYGAEGLLDARENTWQDAAGHSYDYTHIRRVRQFYFSPDIDLSKIPLKQKGLRVLFKVLNAIKIPAPALELSSNGRLKFHPVYF